MTVSFLLPTRDRPEYLSLAIETVRAQEGNDWEIVVSDNSTKESSEGLIRDLGDDRIRYHRTDGSLPVTENWNRALSLSTGDYVLMLGDDDGVLPGYLTWVAETVDLFDQPDAVYTGSRVFTYPSVDPDRPNGFLMSNTYADFLGDEPALITLEQGLAAVRRAMGFHLPFNFNMQVWLLSRRLIERLGHRGPVFQSPFPDYYASCAALLEGRRIVADPREPVVIGVTPKSYGFFHVNERESEGRAFLAADTDSPPQLPGTNINEGWLAAMEAIEANYGRQTGLHVDRRRYRLVQAAAIYGRRRRGTASDTEYRSFAASLPVGERVVFAAANAAAAVVRRAPARRLWVPLADRAQMRALAQFPDIAPDRDVGRYRDLLEVCAATRIE